MVRTVACLAALLSTAGTSSLLAQDKDIKALAATLADSLSRTSKRTVAVVDFNDLQGNVTELGRYLAEELSVALAMADKGIEVVDRTHLRALLQEHRLNATGIIDPITAQKLGQIAGVQVLITGTLTPLGDSVQLAVKALDTNTARIVTGSTTDIAKTKAIEELLSRGINSESPAKQSASGSVTASSSPQEAKAVEAKGFTFVPVFCKASSEKLVCLVRISNMTDHSADLMVTVGEQDSRLVDDRGNQYVPVGVQWGSSVICHRCPWARNSLPPSLPMNLALTFENLSQNALRANLLLSMVLENSARFSVLLRDIPLTR